MRFRIATKMFAGYLAIIVLLCIVSFLGLQGLSRDSAQYEDLVNRTDKIREQARRLDGAEEAKGRALFGYMLTLNPTFHQDSADAIAEADDAIAQLRQLAQDDKTRAAIEQAESANA
ncbi:MAG: hypothetical protein ACM3XM_16750, partial [Mycobacterium leprae]